MGIKVYLFTPTQALVLSKRAKDVTALWCSKPLRYKVGGQIKGLAILCEHLVEKTKVLNGNSREIIGEPTYAVIKVVEVNDNEHFLRFTMRYRKQENDARQLDLFDDKLYN